jgi:hypothetical protein
MANQYEGELMLNGAYDVLSRLRGAGGDGTQFMPPEVVYDAIASAAGAPAPARRQNVRGGGSVAVPATQSRAANLPAGYAAQERAAARQAMPGTQSRAASLPAGYAAQEQEMIRRSSGGAPAAARTFATVAPPVAVTTAVQPAAPAPAARSVAPPAPALPAPAGKAPATATPAAAPVQRREPLTEAELDEMQRQTFMNASDTASGAMELRKLLHGQAKALGYTMDENPNAYSISGLRRKLQEPLPSAGVTDAETIDKYLRAKTQQATTSASTNELYAPPAGSPLAELYATEQWQQLADPQRITVMNGDGGLDPNELAAYAGAGLVRRGTPGERMAFAHGAMNNLSSLPRGLMSLGFAPEDQLPAEGALPIRHIGALLPR